MAHTYFVMKQTGQPDRVLVWDTRTLSIGRAKENDIVLAENEISRRHAVFKKEGNRFGVGDYQTGNGTFVNGQRVSGTDLHPLQSGDVIEIATLLKFEFYDGDAHPAKRGLKLQYASHLKTVGMMPANANPNATMLGMADLPSTEEEDFVIERRSWDDKDGRPPALLDEVLIEKKANEKKIDESLDFIDDPEIEVPPAAKTGPVAKSAPPAAPRPVAKAAPAAKPAPVAKAADPGASQTGGGGDAVERMRRLKSLLAEGLITDAEFERKRAKILEEI
ncbi:MAG TPA: FHA domain-containing protein [Myxococcota bacterium]|nr:FHA domain-containing protein [Myxococcota bacterium]